MIDKNLRGKGLGRILMQKTEEHILRYFIKRHAVYFDFIINGTFFNFSLGLKEAYLSTFDQQGFYSKLGYLFCEQVSIYGASIVKNQWENKVGVFMNLI